MEGMDGMDPEMIELMSQYHEALPPSETPVDIPIDKPVDLPGADIPPKETTEQKPPADPSAPFGRFANGKPRKRPSKASDMKDASTEQIPDSVAAGILIDGAMFIALIDMVLPMIICLINNRFSDEKIKPEDLQLRKDQKNQLTPIVDAVMK